jgi:hypothetical protein
MYLIFNGIDLLRDKEYSFVMRGAPMTLAGGCAATGRSLVVAIICGALIFAGVPPAPSYAQGSSGAAAANIFASYPGGGPGLTQAIKNLVLNDPTSASDVAQYLKNANLTDAQREAAEQGLAEALNQLLLRGEDTRGSALNPTTLMLLGLLAAGLGVGLYYGTKKDAAPVVSPN